MPRRSCSIPGPLCVWDVHASLGLCRSLLPLAFDLEKSSDRVGSEAHGASKSRPSNLKLALVAYWYGPAVCALSSRHIWHLDGKRASGGSHATSKHRAASAGLLATAREPASCTFLIPCIRDARVPQAAAGLRLERRPAGTCVRDRGNRCGLIEINSPEWLPLAACSNAPGISCISADQRARGRPWATAVVLASHMSRACSSLRHRCAVCMAGLGMDMPCDSCG
jgi:hypothetical protein